MVSFSQTPGDVTATPSNVTRQRAYARIGGVAVSVIETGAPGPERDRLHARFGALPRVPRDGAGPFPIPQNSKRRMPADAKEDTRTYIVLVNHEEQYSLWLADKAIPLGWSAVGTPGSREACLAYVKEVWTDMTPKSLRKQTQEA